jgi:P27 family predicted phage terminase small subunit
MNLSALRIYLSVELINDADVGHLALYCDAYSQYLSFKRQVKTKGLWIEGKPNPFIMRMKDAAAQMRSFSADLGLSPAARARLAISLRDEDEDDGEW